MRLLLITHELPPATHGGTQAYVAAIAADRAARGDAVLAICGDRRFDRAGEVEATSLGGVETRRIFRDQATESFSGDLGSDRIRDLILELAREFRPDLVHLHHWHGLSNDLVRALRSEGIPVIVTLHDLFVTCPRHFRMPDAQSFCEANTTLDDCARCVGPDLAALSFDAVRAGLAGRQLAMQAELAAASHRLCVSESQRRLLASLGAFDQRAVEVSPIGINPPAGGAPPAPPGSDRLRIVNWAGLDPRKGPQRLVEAVAGSVHRDRFRLRFHGRHGEADFMRELARLGDGLDLEFPGPFEDDDRRQFAAESDLAVFPFLAFETYGLVVDEALHLGLPVVVPNHGAPAERVGERGCVVARDDVLALRQALEALHASPERLLTMRRAPHLAGTLAAHFGHLATRYQELLEDA